jgi:ribonuclease R
MGHKIPARPSRHELQDLAEAVRGEPAERAVNIGILRSLQRAVYSTSPDGHFALASDHYCHFTSPIRRYPDLVVHRALDLLASGQRPAEPEDDEESPLVALAAEMSRKERAAEAAEQELKLVLVLHHLATKVGEEIVGVVTGVADFGLFVQMPKFLVEGVVKLADLGDDWWDVSAERGTVRGETTGRAIRIGDPLPVQIVEVDVPHRRLVLAVPKNAAAASAKNVKSPKRSNGTPSRRGDRRRR